MKRTKTGVENERWSQPFPMRPGCVRCQLWTWTTDTAVLAGELGLDDIRSWRQESLMSPRPLSLHVHFLPSLILHSPARLWCLISLLCEHTLYPPPPTPVHDASPSILLMSPLWPNWWVNTNKCTLPPSCPGPERPLSFMLPIYSSHSPPTHCFPCSVHYSLCFPLDPERARAWLNSQADSTDCPRVPEQCECVHEWETGRRRER